MLIPLALLLIAGLSSPDFATREMCQSALALCPELAGPPLWRPHPDPEAERRLQDMRQDCEPAWLLGTWDVYSDYDLLYRYRFNRHGEGSYWYASDPAHTYPLVWQYRGTVLNLRSMGMLEVYRIRHGPRWDTSMVPGETPYRLVRGDRVLWTRMVRMH